MAEQNLLTKRNKRKLGGEARLVGVKLRGKIMHKQDLCIEEGRTETKSDKSVWAKKSDVLKQAYIPLFPLLGT